MCRLFCLAVLFLAALPARAATSPAGAVPAVAVPVEVIAVRGDTVVVRTRSPRKALLYSLVPTVGGFVLSSVASSTLSDDPTAEPSGLASLAMTGASVLLFTGPSFGHFYAGNNRAARNGMLVRGGALTIAFLGLLSALNEGGSGDLPTGALVAVTAGSLLYFGSTVYDIATAPSSAHRANTRGVRVSMAPVVGAQRGVRIAVRM
jgi:hypothetical protein